MKERWKRFYANYLQFLGQPNSAYYTRWFHFFQQWGKDWCNEQKKKNKTKQPRTWKVPEALDFWTVRVFISRLGVLFECLPNTHPLLILSLACSHFLFDAGAIVLSGSCCFYWVANPPFFFFFFTSPEMKAKSKLWECSLKTPLKRDSYHHSTVWELHFPCFPLIRDKQASVVFFFYY